LSSVQEYLPGSVSQAFHLSADALIGSLLVLRTGEHGSNNTQAYPSVLRGSLVVSIHLSVAADWRTWLQHQKKNKQAYASLLPNSQAWASRCGATNLSWSSAAVNA